MLVGLGGPKNSEIGIGSVLRSRYEWITQNSFRTQMSQVEIRETDFKEAAEECPAIIAREKIN